MSGRRLLHSNSNQTLTIKPLRSDVGREVFLADVSNVHVVLKYWDQQRLQLSNGGNTAQVFNELRARMSSLSSCQYVVAPLHVSLSREGGATLAYPYAGRSMDAVCAELRAAGQQAALVSQLAQMATSVLLVLQKLQELRPKAWVHRDIKLSNLLLGDDGLVRVADFGNACEVYDTSTAHDPNYFPPDWAALLPDGRHTFEDPASLAATNTGLLDLRGLGLALIEGFAGRLPQSITLEAAGSCLSASRDTACSGSSSTCSAGACSWGCECGERARLRRLAHHDWSASIDILIPDAPVLNQLVKLLLGPKQHAPSLSQLLQQPFIKTAHRQVLDTARRARRAWQAHVAACRAVLWQVAGPLMQLEQHCVRVCAHNGSLSTAPPLSQQLDLLSKLHEQQQKQQQQDEQCSAADIGPATTSSAGVMVSRCSSLSVHQLQLHTSSCASSSSTSSASADKPYTHEWASSSSTDSSCAAPATPTAAQECCTLRAGDTCAAATGHTLQAAIAAVLSQVAALRPDAAARVCQLQKELSSLVAGDPALLQGPLLFELPNHAAAEGAASAATDCGTLSAGSAGTADSLREASYVLGDMSPVGAPQQQESAALQCAGNSRSALSNMADLTSLHVSLQLDSGERWLPPYSCHYQAQQQHQHKQQTEQQTQWAATGVELPAPSGSTDVLLGRSSPAAALDHSPQHQHTPPCEAWCSPGLQAQPYSNHHWDSSVGDQQAHQDGRCWPPSRSGVPAEGLSSTDELLLCRLVEGPDTHSCPRPNSCSPMFDVPAVAGFVWQRVGADAPQDIWQPAVTAPVADSNGGSM